MSGHSKWASIKHKKGAADAKRGKLFSKLAKEITVAAKIGGPDPAANPRLKLACMKGREANMPNKNIDAAIKRAAGAGDGAEYMELIYEGYGPAGVAFLIQCLTDNKNRTVSEVRSTLTKNGGNLGESGSVSWQFEKKGIVQIEKDKIDDDDALMELAIEAGADDVISEEEGYTVKCEPDEFESVLETVKAKGIETVNAEITMVAKNTVPIGQEQAEKLEKLTELLDDLDDVQSVSSNEEITG